jgi:hypothetical protein
LIENNVENEQDEKTHVANQEKIHTNFFKKTTIHIIQRLCCKKYAITKHMRSKNYVVKKKNLTFTKNNYKVRNEKLK